MDGTGKGITGNSGDEDVAGASLNTLAALPIADILALGRHSSLWPKATTFERS